MRSHLTENPSRLDMLNNIQRYDAVASFSQVTDFSFPSSFIPFFSVSSLCFVWLSQQLKQTNSKTDRSTVIEEGGNTRALSIVTIFSYQAPVKNHPNLIREDLGTRTQLLATFVSKIAALQEKQNFPVAEVITNNKFLIDHSCSVKSAVNLPLSCLCVHGPTRSRGP